MAGEALFNNARGEASTLQMAPPFAFSDVKMTVFPLQANLARLEQFCNSYLNQAGDIVQFKPFLPFIYLIILDYGRMSAPATQTGWVSQREVAFGVPLQWLEPGADGKMTFKDFAFTTPFIFVDNELSLSTGREVYGWPKLLARLDPRVDEWISDPHGARRVFEIRSRAAADHAGDDLKAPFLSVTQTPLTGLLDFPPNLTSATQAAAAWPSALVGIARAIRDAGAALGGIAIEKVRKAENLSALCKLGGTSRIFSTDRPSRLLTAKHWAEIADGVRGMFPKLYSNTINLKQFRDAENPMEACYQAITAARMPIMRFGRGGFLGTQNLLMGQMDGGYRVNILNTATVPVVSQLGLVEAGQQEVDGGLLSSFAPVCPFWIEIDMVYDLGQTLAMRARSGDWRRPTDDQEGGMAPTPGPGPSRPKPAPESSGDSVEELQDSASAMLNGGVAEAAAGDQAPKNDYYQIEASNPFNTTRGASEALGGVFRLKDARVRVLPLLADPAVLGQFVEKYIQVPDHMRVEAWGRYVYMLSTQYETITSDLAPGKRGHACEVTFAVPVKCYDWHEGEQPEIEPPDDLSGPTEAALWQRGAAGLIGTAMVTPFNYVDDITAAITQSEVFGVPTLRSEIVSPPDGWAAPTAQNGVLLQANAIVVPSLGTGAEGVRKTLVEVRDTPMVDPEDRVGWRHIATEWGDRLATDLFTKALESGIPERGNGPTESFRWGRAMALRILGGLHGVDTLSFKQFRDATQPRDACYQGVVVRSTTIENLHSLDEIDRDLTVSITRYPTQPIAETLGLIPKRTVVKDDGVCDEFEPLRPFELCADLISSGGKTLFERAGLDDWSLVNLPAGPLGWRPVDEKQVDRHARQAEASGFPNPKISYVRFDQRSARYGRLKPLLLTDREYRAYLEDLRQQNASDTMILWRGVELGSLLEDEVLDAMDAGKISDIHGFVRTRPTPDDTPQTDEPEATDENDAGSPVFRLAGSLELITPATILDAILSRGWASRRRRDTGAMRSQLFRLRRTSLGPELSDHLFPTRESQGGFWPRSREFAFAAIMRDAMAENSFPQEFGKFVEVVKQFEEDLEEVEEIAKRTLPAWFLHSALTGETVVDRMFRGDDDDTAEEQQQIPDWVLGLKQMSSLTGVWPRRYKEELRDAMAVFFEELMRIGREKGQPSAEIDFFGREWTRLTRRLVEEALPDGFTEKDKPSLEYLMETEDLKLNPRTPGWLHARLTMLAAGDEYPIKRLVTLAGDWQEEFIQKWRT